MLCAPTPTHVFVRRDWISSLIDSPTRVKGFSLLCKQRDELEECGNVLWNLMWQSRGFFHPGEDRTHFLWCTDMVCFKVSRTLHFLIS
ncbi:rCG29805 [Rattus norvegicus]|uniref:RCG29805 n=1 Tax=Rattus norvegicus TaxID=10116 RepID=A6IM86_RAT|nr:rCG29805 [Rattus norvegicus]